MVQGCAWMDPAPTALHATRCLSIGAHASVARWATPATAMADARRAFSSSIAGASVRLVSREHYLPPSSSSSSSSFRCASSGSSARPGEVKQEDPVAAVADECEHSSSSNGSSAGSANGRATSAQEVEARSGGSIPGLILGLTTVGKSTNIVWEGCMVRREERQRLLNQKGCVVWITGLSSSGKSTLACTLDHALLKLGKLSYVLDGDNVRHGLNNNLGFSHEDRAENIRRVGEVAKLFADTGVICIASFISPYKRDRDACRQLMMPGDFIEVFMDVPLEVCEGRDPKGLYKLARAGKIKGFTGVDDPYEDPPQAEVVMKAHNGVCASPQEMTAQMLAYLEEHGFLHGT